MNLDTIKEYRVILYHEKSRDNQPHTEFEQRTCSLARQVDALRPMEKTEGQYSQAMLPSGYTLMVNTIGMHISYPFKYFTSTLVHEVEGGIFKV